MHSSEPFAGALSNLEKLVTKNNRELRKLSARMDQGGPPQIETERCIRLHIELIHWIVKDEPASDSSDICQRALEAFQRCLYIPMQDVDYAAQDLLSEEVVDEMALSLLVPLGNPKLNGKSRNKLIARSVGTHRALLILYFSMKNYFLTECKNDCFTIDVIQTSLH